MNPQIEKLSQLVDESTSTVNRFSADKISEKLIGDWTIKEMLQHISGWNVHTISVLQNLKQNKLSEWGEETDEFNHQSVAARTSQSWEEAYEEFVDTSQQLISEYQSLSDSQFHQRIYIEDNYSQYTPESFLKTDVDHYQEHLDAIKLKIK